MINNKCKNCGKFKENHLEANKDLYCTNSQHDNRKFEIMAFKGQKRSNSTELKRGGYL